MGFIDKLKSLSDTIKESKTSGKEFYEEVFYAVGTSYYLNNIKKVLKPNKEYLSFPGTIIKNGHAGRKIYEYLLLDTKAQLIPEPTNKHDKNAIKVCIYGKTVGYIKREETRQIKQILDETYIEYINAFISGGKYKVVSLDKSACNIDAGFTVSVKIGYYK